MPAQIARNLVLDPRMVYANYETLVGSTLRRPASSDNDRHRKAVASLLFGYFDSEIRYGNLAIANEALPSYGDIACRLRTEAVKKRTSFLEENSYVFVRKYGLKPGDPIPPGYRAVWDNRSKLALAKVGHLLRPGQPEGGLMEILVKSSAARANDEFIEAHIYGGFSVDAIESMTRIPTSTKATREKELDTKIAIAEFNKRKSAQ
jgi:hypothetical protein